MPFFNPLCRTAHCGTITERIQAGTGTPIISARSIHTVPFFGTSCIKRRLILLLLLKGHMVTTYITNLCPVPQAVGSIWPFFRYIWPQWPNFQHTTFLWLCVLHSKDPKRPDRPYYCGSYKRDLLTVVTLQIGFLRPSDILISWQVHYLRENLWFLQSGNPTLSERKQSAKWQS